jgi:hypothetical protein
MGRILSSIGIGNATVDTVFPDTTVTAGETVAADVEVRGAQSRMSRRFTSPWRRDTGATRVRTSASSTS